MTGTDWLNIFLWLIDTCLVLTIFLVYFFFLRFYNQWQVWPINSAHDNINSTDWARIIKNYQIEFKLEDYQIDFVSNQNFRLFSNLQRRQKRILLTKKIFPSVGYELNYWISRLWITQKKLNHDSTIRRYWWFTKVMPIIFLFLIILFYFFETIFFFFGLNVNGLFAQDFFKFLWNAGLLGFLIIFFVAGWIINYYLAASLKHQVEQKYESEIKQHLAKNLDYFEFDFKVARQYDQAIWIPYLLIFGSHQEKWFGAFVY